MSYIELDEVDSTNDYVKRNLNKLPNLSVVRCNYQTNGRGRNGHVWQSKNGDDLLMSILVKDFKKTQDLHKMTQLVACSVAGLLDRYGIKAKIKWPNDIVSLSGKKLCGILTEMSAEIDYINYVVIGIGVNVNQDSFPQEIKERATSLYLELGHKVQRSQLIAAIMESFEECYEKFMETEDLSGLMEAYNSLLVNRGREVKILEPGHEYEAVAMGINETGELIVKTADGQEKEIFAGEVSVRGVYGYV